MEGSEKSHGGDVNRVEGGKVDLTKVIDGAAQAIGNLKNAVGDYFEATGERTKAAEEAALDAYKTLVMTGFKDQIADDLFQPYVKSAPNALKAINDLEPLETQAIIPGTSEYENALSFVTGGTVKWPEGARVDSKDVAFLVRITATTKSDGHKDSAIVAVDANNKVIGIDS